MLQRIIADTTYNLKKEKTKNDAIRYLINNKKLKLPKNVNFIDKYLHVIYQPLSNSEIEFLERETDLELPEDYKDFLKESNGAYLFSGMISIFGFGRILKNGAYITCRDPKYDLPFHFSEYNLNHDGNIYIGQYNEMNIGYKGNDTKTIYVFNDSGKSIEKYNDLKTFINTKCELLSKYYDENGVCTDLDLSDNFVFNTPNNF